VHNDKVKIRQNGGNKLEPACASYYIEHKISLYALFGQIKMADNAAYHRQGIMQRGTSGLPLPA